MDPTAMEAVRRTALKLLHDDMRASWLVSKVATQIIQEQEQGFEQRQPSEDDDDASIQTCTSLDPRVSPGQSRRRAC